MIMKGLKRAWEFTADAGAWGVASIAGALLSFGMSWWEHYHDRSLSSRQFLALSVIAFWLGGFQAWGKKARELEQEKARNAKPAITGRIVHVGLGMVGTTTSEGTTTTNCDLSLKLSITSRNSIETTLKDALLIVENRGQRYEGERYSIRHSFYQGAGHSEKMNDLIETTTYSNPVRYRVASDGWLSFSVVGLEPPDKNSVMKVDVVVTLIDELDGRHKIAGKGIVVR